LSESFTEEYYVLYLQDACWLLISAAIFSYTLFLKFTRLSAGSIPFMSFHSSTSWVFSAILAWLFSFSFSAADGMH